MTRARRGASRTNAYRAVIRNGTVVDAAGENKAEIAIGDHVLAEIAHTIDASAEEEIDATGLHIFPGCVDPHVHFNEPGRSDWEGFASGSRALAGGGCTTFFDMPVNSIPPTVNADALRVKRAAAERASVVDFGFWGGLVPGGVEQLDELAEAGVIGFKAFMIDTGMDEFEMADDLTLYEGMARAAKLDLPVAVHAENAVLTRGLAQRARKAGRTGIRDFLNSRPVIAEVEAITRAISFAEDTNCTLHIVHVTTGRGVRAVAEARSRGVDVSCETCTHYLVFDESDMERLGAIAKCAPPLRAAAVREDLWQTVLAGGIDFVASDHSPAPPELKADADFFSVWGGISGCQALLVTLLTEGISRNLPLERVPALTSTTPASRFRIADRKGRIEAGLDADLVLVDVGTRSQLEASDLYYRHRHSPYVGRPVGARIVRTILRGATIFSDGAFRAGEPGRFIFPSTRAR